jgi:SAM-dependent methyltransferase
MQDKNHWYDGWFYDRLIAPNQDRLFKTITGMIRPGSSVIDIGCGTGRLCFKLSHKVGKIVGIDLSSKNILRAEGRRARHKLEDVEFYHLDARDVELNGNPKYDYAVFTYVLHEMSENDRIEALRRASKIAETIIIGDYIYPHPKSFWGILNIIVEYLAGREHYNNFKNYISQRGLPGLIDRTDLRILEEIKNKPATSHLIKVGL